MKEENQKKQNHEESPKNSIGVTEPSTSTWKKLLSKRWVYPAAYVAAAAIILTLVWVYQDAGSNKPLQSDTTVTNSATLPAGGSPEVDNGSDKTVNTMAVSEDFAWPVANAKEVKIVKPFYEKEGTPEDHQAALVQYNDTFIPNTGIDLAREDGKPFEVKAAMSGKVTRVEDHAVLGYVVEITHAKNLKTVYESLTDVAVKQGQEVKLGDKIASAGRNEMEKDLGNHVHFAVYENDELVNPTTVLPQN